MKKIETVWLTCKSILVLSITLFILMCTFFLYRNFQTGQVTTHNLELNKNNQSNKLPLDSIPATHITGAWSIRKLRTAYTGSCMRIRRSSDNTETDVGFDRNNMLSLSSPVSVGGNLKSWIGLANGFVVTLYDQGEAKNNMTNTNPSQQPIIIFAGSLIKNNSKPSVYYDGSKNLNAAFNVRTPLNSKMTFFSVVEFEKFGGGVGSLCDKRDPAKNYSGYTFYGAPNVFGMQWNTAERLSSIESTSASIQTNTLYSLNSTAELPGEVKLYQGLEKIGGGFIPSSIDTTDISLPFLMGGHSDTPSLQLIGNLFEMILLNTVVMPTQRESIVSSQLSFFSV